MYPEVEFNVTIRIKIGNIEAEVSGPKLWVEKQIEKMIKLIKGGFPPPPSTILRNGLAH